MSAVKWYFLCVWLKLIDVVTTAFLVSRHGTEGELNPLVRYTMEQWGILSSMTINFLFIFVICSILLMKNKIGILKGALIVLAPVAVSNTVQVILSITGSL